MQIEQIQLTVERIWVKGEEGLVVIKPVEGDYVRYHVPGLESQLEIWDYRSVDRAALETANTSAGLFAYSSKFESSALVSIRRNGSGVTLELKEPTGAAIQAYDMLWITARAKGSPPLWPATWKIQSQSHGDRYSFVAILE